MSSRLLGGTSYRAAMPPKPGCSIACRRSSAAHEYAGTRALVVAVAQHGDPTLDGRDVALGLLDESTRARGQVVDHLGARQAQALVVDEVDVAEHPGREHA